MSEHDWQILTDAEAIVAAEEVLIHRRVWSAFARRAAAGYPGAAECCSLQTAAIELAHARWMLLTGALDHQGVS